MNRAADETAKIEHELEVLRSRYAIFKRWAGITKWFFIGLAVIMTSVGVSYGLVYDPLVAAIIVVVVAVLGVALYLTSDGDWRWIDTVSPPPGWPHGYGFGPWNGPKSEAMAIETMIAEREARLADIREQHA